MKNLINRFFALATDEARKKTEDKMGKRGKVKLLSNLMVIDSGICGIFF